jgi:hypothetical protein
MPEDVTLPFRPTCVFTAEGKRCDLADSWPADREQYTFTYVLPGRVEVTQDVVALFRLANGNWTRGTFAQGIALEKTTP